MKMIYNLGDLVTSSTLYDHKEVMKVVGIREDSLELEGDYSGGTHNVSQRDWIPLDTIRFADQSTLSNSRKGSRHWYNMLLSGMMHIGGYMVTHAHDGKFMSDMAANWGKYLQENGRELIDNYNKIKQAED